MASTSTRECIFVLGYPRSGTTLLRALLGAHSSIQLYNEPELVRAMRESGFWVGDRLGHDRREEFLGRLSRIGACRRHIEQLPGSVVARFAAAREPLGFREVYEALLPVESGARIWGEKSLGNVFYVRELAALYPRALFVDIVRDPRAALLSYYRKKLARGQDACPTFSSRAVRFFAFQTLQWLAWRDALAEGADAARGAIHRVRFEDLVVDPEREMRRLCDAIGLPFERQMLDAARRRGDPALRPSSAYAHTKLDGPIDETRASASADLPAWAAAIVERYAAREIETLGYAPCVARPAAFERLRLGLELRRYAARARSRLERAVAARAHPSTTGSDLWSPMVSSS